MDAKETPRILIVGSKNPENDPIAAYLEAAEFKTTLATTSDASDLILEGGAQAVILRAPNFEGANALFNENFVGPARTIPTILISNQDLIISKVDLMERGFIAHLKDPVDHSELLKILSNSLTVQEEKNKRRHDRKTVKHNVKWHASDSTELYDGIIQNLSEGGMFIKSNKPYPREKGALAFEIYIDEDGEVDNPIQGFGLVRWYNDENGFGIEFTAMTKKSSTLIKRLMTLK